MPTDANRSFVPVPDGFWYNITVRATTAVNVLLVGGQLVLEGLVALGTFLVHLAEAVWDWGMALAGAVSEAAQAAGEALADELASFVDWAIQWAISTMMAAIQPLLDAVNSVIGPWTANQSSALQRVAPGGESTIDPLRAAQTLLNALLFGKLWLALVGMTIALTAATLLLTPLQFTPIGIVISVVLGLLVPIIIEATTGFLMGDVEAPSDAFKNPDETWGISLVVEPGDPWWSTQLGAALVSLLPFFISLLKADARLDFLTGDGLGVVASILGLLTVFVGGEFGVWLGFVLAVWGFTIALRPDITDQTSVTAVKYWEEVLTGASVVVGFGSVYNCYSSGC